LSSGIVFHPFQYFIPIPNQSAICVDIVIGSSIRRGGPAEPSPCRLGILMNSAWQKVTDPKQIKLRAPQVFMAGAFFIVHK
jgi:hypothetical protein